MLPATGETLRHGCFRTEMVEPAPCAENSRPSGKLCRPRGLLSQGKKAIEERTGAFAGDALPAGRSHSQIVIAGQGFSFVEVLDGACRIQRCLEPLRELGGIPLGLRCLVVDDEEPALLGAPDTVGESGEYDLVG